MACGVVANQLLTDKMTDVAYISMSSPTHQN
ncbi:uncharacterized protein G2W53_007098 [Senna tora]|uniref:Uncharacterized protein n=1 Tax=Senna tora TaxID=362788 RepID=A0A835CD80_9FABA|nr:uncharacterized protein G2W53_007098 [Senna tora]